MFILIYYIPAALRALSLFQIWSNLAYIYSHSLLGLVCGMVSIKCEIYLRYLVSAIHSQYNVKETHSMR